MQKRHIAVVLSTSLAALFLTWTSPTYAAEPTRPGGEKTWPCEQCHGHMGCAPVQGLIPRLCGQNVEYLQATLLQFRDGRRPEPVMHEISRFLSDKDVKALAEYFANAPCSKK